jgi:hypothetical protein
MRELAGRHRGLALSALDLLPRQGDYAEGAARARTERAVLARLRRFEDVMRT